MAIARYFAEDGTEFKTLEEAEAHDRRHSFADLCGLAEADIDAMLAGQDPKRAELAEVLGNQLAKARRERGEFKRAPKASSPPPPAPSTAETPPCDVEQAPSEEPPAAPPIAPETVDDLPI